MARRPRASTRRALRHQRVGCRRDRGRTPLHAARVPGGAILAAHSPDGRLEARRRRRTHRAEPHDERQRAARCGNGHAGHVGSDSVSRPARTALPRAPSGGRAILPPSERPPGRWSARGDRMECRGRYEVRHLPSRPAWRAGDISVRALRHRAARIPEGRAHRTFFACERRRKRCTTIEPGWRASR